MFDNRWSYDLNIGNNKNEQQDKHVEPFKKQQIKSDCHSEISIGVVQNQFIQNKDNKKDLKPSKKRTFQDLMCEDAVQEKSELEDEIMSIATNNSESGQSEMCTQPQVNQISSVTQQSLQFSNQPKPFKIQRKMNRPKVPQCSDNRISQNRKMKLNEESVISFDDLNQKVYLSRQMSQTDGHQNVSLSNYQPTNIKFNNHTSLFNHIPNQSEPI